jgi:hypothetical protein
MTTETKETLAKVGKTVLTGLIGAAIGVGVIVGIWFLKKNSSSGSSGEG